VKEKATVPQESDFANVSLLFLQLLAKSTH